ncbi:MAG: peptidoglycan-binding protein [Deltaproteobacteria bacterium]|nr:peptidoglycan-binding protein [Deltaproteobacteria bacterium]
MAYPLLRVGASGSQVSKLQELLERAGTSAGAVDGDFGKQTQEAVKAFQRARGLDADGIVGKATWAALDGFEAPKQTQRRLSEGDRFQVSPENQTGTVGKVPSSGDANPFHEQFIRAARAVGVPESWASSPALMKLVEKESGFDPSARNKRSTAQGLFQMLKGTYKGVGMADSWGTQDPYTQAVAGFSYIKERYKTPERAYAFHKSHGYY